MTKQDIIRKLTSRKFWMALALFISGLIVAFGGGNEIAETVSGCIMQGASVLGYLLAEGLADSVRDEVQNIYIEGKELLDESGSTNEAE